MGSPQLAYPIPARVHFLVVTVAMTESSTGEKLIKTVFSSILLNWVSALVIDHEAVVFWGGVANCDTREKCNKQVLLMLPTCIESGF